MLARSSASPLIAALVLSWPAAASAGPSSWLGEQYAQSYSRTATAAADFARKLGLDPSWISYCQTSLRIQTGSPLIASVYPFNVQLPEDGPTQQATDVLKVREEFERNYLMLCLANAKKALAN